MDIKKNRCYILQEPKHISCSVVYANEDFCNLDQESCDTFDILSRITDVFIIFPKSLTKKINPIRFSSLMNSCGYIIDEPEIEVESVMYCLKYIDNVFGKRHLNVFYLNNFSHCCHNLKGIIEDTFLDIQQKQFHCHIFEKLRLSSESLREIYLENSSDNGWFKKFITPSDDSLGGMFCSHSTNDSILFLKVNLLRELFNCDEISDTYVKTFKNYSFGTFISSALSKFFPESLMNHNILDIK